MDNENGIYVFCGIQSDQQHNFGKISFEGENREIYMIHVKDAAMVVADVPMKIYHPNKENLMMHQQVISTVMEKNDTVVPISFGHVFKSEADVTALIQSLLPQFQVLFPKIKGKIEVGLKVIGKKDWLEGEIQKSDTVMMKKQTVSKKSAAAGYFDRIQLGEMAKDFFKELQQEIKRDIHDSLTPLSEADRINDPIGEKMLLNAAYLIDRDQENAFDAKVNAVYEPWKDKVDFKYSGPWPAYNFINIKLKVEEAT